MNRELKPSEGLPSVFAEFRFSYLGLFAPFVWSFCIKHRTDVDYGGLDVAAVMYFSMALAMLAFALVSMRMPERLFKKLLGWPIAVLCCAATCFLAFPLPFSVDVAPIASAVGGICIAGMYLKWVDFYADMDTRNSIACIFCTCILASCVKVVVDLSPAAPATIILMSMPILSVAFHGFARKHQPAVETKPVIYFEKAKNYLPWRILVGIGAYSLIIGVVPVVALPSITMHADLFSLAQHGGEVVMCLIVLWWVFGRHGRLSFPTLWRAVILLTATGLFFIPVTGPEWISWAMVLVSMAQTLMVMLLWAMLADTAHHSTASPSLIFGCAWTVYVLPIGIGRALGASTAFADNNFFLTFLAYVLTLVAMYALNDKALMQSRIFADLEAPAPTEKMFESIEEGCEKLGERYGLTAREVEVVALLCKGRSKSYIAETLFISENTVRSHSRRIYQKLDVHNKQEIIDRIATL